MATKCNILTPLANKSGKKVFFEETTYEFCPELWNIIKSYFLYDKYIYSFIMYRRFDRLQCWFQKTNSDYSYASGKWSFTWGCEFGHHCSTVKTIKKNNLTLFNMYNNPMYKEKCITIIKKFLINEKNLSSHHHAKYYRRSNYEDDYKFYCEFINTEENKIYYNEIASIIKSA